MELVPLRNEKGWQILNYKVRKRETWKKGHTMATTTYDATYVTEVAG